MKIVALLSIALTIGCAGSDDDRSLVPSPAVQQQIEELMQSSPDETFPVQDDDGVELTCLPMSSTTSGDITCYTVRCVHGNNSFSYFYCTDGGMMA